MAQNDDSTMNITKNTGSEVSNISSLGDGATVAKAEPELHSNINGTGSDMEEGNGYSNGNGNNDGFEAVDEANTEASPRVEANSNVQDRIHPDPNAALEEIKRQDTHDLFCPNCRNNITTTALLYPKGQKPPPIKEVGNNASLLPNSTTEEPVVNTNVPAPIRTSEEPAVTTVTDPLTQSSTTELVPSPNPVNTPRLHWTCHDNLPFLLVVVLLLLSVIVLSLKGIDVPIIITPIKIGGGTWVISFPSFKFLPLLLLVFLPILALRLPTLPTLALRLPTLALRLPSVSSLITDPTPLFQFLRENIVVPLQNLLLTEPDILKSIVYGGLVESITSLGVVSSAAATGASTLNVLALGLANLSSGLFLIIHNLYGLLMSPIQNPDPYQNLLGDRRKFKRHCIVVVVSFIFFGVIPPLFYGLSFQKTDKGHYKALVVLVASLVCVISLSFAKAKAFLMPNKLKTVAEYTGMAIGASALSFITSQILGDLFEKYGFHELAADYRQG